MKSRDHNCYLYDSEIEALEATLIEKFDAETEQHLFQRDYRFDEGDCTLRKLKITVEVVDG